VPTPEPTPAPTPEPTPVPASSSTTSQMVWVDDTAKKYHRKSDCSGMDAAYEVTKEVAESMGKTPCKKCFRK
jgi:hypothetical protein